MRCNIQYVPLSCGIYHQYFAVEARKNDNRKYHGDRLLCNNCGKNFKTKSTLATAHNQERVDSKSYFCPFEGCGKKNHKEAAVPVPL